MLGETISGRTVWLTTKLSSASLAWNSSVCFGLAGREVDLATVKDGVESLVSVFIAVLSSLVTFERDGSVISIPRNERDVKSSAQCVLLRRTHLLKAVLLSGTALRMCMRIIKPVVAERRL